MNCAICGAPATRVLKCSACGEIASHLCDGYVCQPEVWAMKKYEPRSSIPLMNLECEHCPGKLSMASAPPRPRPLQRLESEVPRSIFPTTQKVVGTFFSNKPILLITNVFGDGLGDLGQGAKLARQLRELGAKVTFVVCCLTKDKEAITRTLGDDAALAHILSGSEDFGSMDRNPIPIAAVTPHKDLKTISAANAADLVLAFPTTAQLKKEHLKEPKKFMLIEECVQFGTDILGFGLVGGPTVVLANSEQGKRRRLGVLLNDMGPCAKLNIDQLQQGNLRFLLTRGMQVDEWRKSNVFSVGYVKMPEGKVGLVPSSPFSFGHKASPVEMKMSSMGLMKKPLVLEKERPLITKSSTGSGGTNVFMDNYIELMCCSTLKAESIDSVTLYCPNFDPARSNFKWKLTTKQGGFSLYEGNVAKRQLFIVSGNVGQDDFHKLLNEAALNGQLHERPILVGAAGEGSLSEVFSLQACRGVFPIYSPRYPYQRDNLLRLAAECKSSELARLLGTIMDLHLSKDLPGLWQEILEMEKPMLAAQALVHKDYNFLNLLYLRLKGEL